MVKLNTRIVAVLTAVCGALLIIVSSILLADVVMKRNQQNDLYFRNTYDRYDSYFWNRFRLDEDLILVLAPLTLLVGLVQLMTPLTLCYGLQDKRRSTQIWIGVYGVLVLLSVFCFVLGIVYQIDNRKVFHQTNTYGNKYIHNYASYGGNSGYNSGRQYVGDSYDTSWWKYEKGQAYLGVLGCDVFVIMFVLGWMIRRLCVMKDDDDGGKYSRKNYKYEPQYDRGSSASPVSHHSQFERTSQVYHVQPPKQDRSPSPMYQGPPPRQERTPSPMYQYQGPPPRQEQRRSPSPMYQYQGPPLRQERSSPV